MAVCEERAGACWHRSGQPASGRTSVAAHARAADGRPRSARCGERAPSASRPERRRRRRRGSGRSRRGCRPGPGSGRCVAAVLEHRHVGHALVLDEVEVRRLGGAAPRSPVSGYAVMNVSTGVNQSARPLEAGRREVADQRRLVADRHAADAHVVDEVVEAPVLGLAGAQRRRAERRLAGVERAERRRERHDAAGGGVVGHRR